MQKRRLEKNGKETGAPLKGETLLLPRSGQRVRVGSDCRTEVKVR